MHLMSMGSDMTQRLNTRTSNLRDHSVSEGSPCPDSSTLQNPHYTLPLGGQPLLPFCWLWMGLRFLPVWQVVVPPCDHRRLLLLPSPVGSRSFPATCSAEAFLLQVFERLLFLSSPDTASPNCLTNPPMAQFSNHLVGSPLLSMCSSFSTS